MCQSEKQNPGRSAFGGLGQGQIRLGRIGSRKIPRLVASRATYRSVPEPVSVCSGNRIGPETCYQLQSQETRTLRNRKRLDSAATNADIEPPSIGPSTHTGVASVRPLGITRPRV